MRPAPHDAPPPFVDWRRDANDILSGLTIVFVVIVLLLVGP